MKTTELSSAFFLQYLRDHPGLSQVSHLLYRAINQQEEKVAVEIIRNLLAGYGERVIERGKGVSK